jgi:2-polyprenyl-3-methyl-5-hydroxy-6-metoxy-1,4-benzoquinol methylase
MKEYLGKSAKVYELSNRKELCLTPAIKRLLPKAKENQSLLDIGCGHGDFYSLSKSKGYKYIGFDLSKEMVSIAQSAYKAGKFRVANSTNFTKEYKQKFDTIISILLLNCLPAKKLVLQTLRECYTSLKSDGMLLLGLPHPAYDKYMQKGLLGDKATQGKFQGYFASEAHYIFNKKFSKGTFKFSQTHFTLSDHFQLLNKAGFYVTAVDECPPPDKLKKTNLALHTIYSQFPGYIILVCKKYSSFTNLK